MVQLAQRRAGRFILATNVLDQEILLLPDDEVLREYKGQQSSERGFGLLVRIPLRRGCVRNLRPHPVAPSIQWRGVAPLSQSSPLFHCQGLFENSSPSRCPGDGDGFMLISAEGTAAFQPESNSRWVGGLHFGSEAVTTGFG